MSTQSADQFPNTNSQFAFGSEFPQTTIHTPSGFFRMECKWIHKNKRNHIYSEITIPLSDRAIFPMRLELDNVSYTIRYTFGRGTVWTPDWKINSQYRRNEKENSITLEFYFYRRDTERADQHRLELVKDFKTLHSPFLQKFRIGKTVQGLFGDQTEWRQIEFRLSDELILKARTGQKLIGYFLTYTADVCGIDLDFHNQEQITEIQMMEVYEELVSSVGLYPSFVYRSKRGLHLYFKFEQRAPFEILRKRLMEGLAYFPDVQAEILPSPSQTLKIDPVSSYLCPKTLQSIDPPKIEQIQKYSLSSFFGYDMEELKEWKKPKHRRERAVSFRKQRNLEILEEQVLPIRKSNTLFRDCALIPAYFRYGLTLEQATDRVIGLLKLSGYTGELNNFNRLHQRMSSAWIRLEETSFQFKGITEERQLLLSDVSFVENLLRESPFSNRRNQKLKSFLTELIGWIRYHQDMRREEFEWWSLFYTYRENRFVSGYRIFRKRGWIPLPSVLMEKWDFRYKEFISFLISKKVLKIETGYSVEKAQCRYFSFRELLCVSRIDSESILEEIRSYPIPQIKKAQILNLNRTTLSKYLTGDRTPSGEILEQIKRAWTEFLGSVDKTEKHLHCQSFGLEGFGDKTAEHI